MLYLLANPTCKCFKSIIENIHYILIKHEIPVIIMQSYNYNDDCTEDIWIVIWNSLEKLPKKCIIYNLDPLIPKIKDMLNKLIAKSPDSTILQFIDYCYGSNYKAISSLCIPYVIIPYGYSSYYEHLKNKYISKTSIPTKEIDVLFYGNVTGRRSDLLKEIVKFCKENSFKIMICNNNLYDDGKKLLMITKSRIVISLASSDAKNIGTNDLARLSLVLSIGEFVITEYIGDHIVEDTMSKYVPHCKTKEEILERIKHFLLHEDDRHNMINIANKKFRKDFNFEKDFISNLSIEQFSCYSRNRSVLVLSNETCENLIDDVLDPICCLIRGLKDNKVKIYSNINSSSFDNLEGKHNYILDINRKNIVAYLDFSDDNMTRVINSEYKTHCKCYFKRECTNELKNKGCITFP